MKALTWFFCKFKRKKNGLNGRIHFGIHVKSIKTAFKVDDVHSQSDMLTLLNSIFGYSKSI